MGAVRIFRCPRCRAEDISADAHPTRVLDNGVERPFFVCRNCYRAAELEYRIACDRAGVTYAPLGIRQSLTRLRDFYRERIGEYIADASLEDEADIVHASAHVRTALTDVERRLAIAPVDAT